MLYTLKLWLQIPNSIYNHRLTIIVNVQCGLKGSNQVHNLRERKYYFAANLNLCDGFYHKL